MLYLHALHSDVVIVYFRCNVVCKKCCICAWHSDDEIVYFLHDRHSDVGIVYFRCNVVCKECRICTLATRMLGLFIFVIVLFVRSVVSARLTLGWWDCLFSARLTLGWWDCLFSARLTLRYDGIVYFRHNVVCKKCRICTLGTRMMGLFIFVIMLFVRSVVSALLTFRWWYCLFSATLDTLTMRLFIFVIMLFVRSVVSARSTLGWCDCLFSL